MILKKLSSKILLTIVVVILSIHTIALVNAGVPITLEDQHDFVIPGETAWFKFNLEEVEASDKTIQMWVEDLPASWTYDFSPIITSITSLGTTTTTLNIHVPLGATGGSYEFTVYVKANDVIIPILEQITTYSGPLNVIPEVPLGTMMGITSMIIALSLYIGFPRNRFKTFLPRSN